MAGLLESESADDDALERRWTAVALLAIVGLWLAMAAPWLAGRWYVFNDLGAYHLPLRVFYAACLERGDAFDWMPQLYCGWFVTGEGQLGGYHPWHWLLYRALPWPTAFGLEILANYAFLTGGLYVLFRRSLTRSAAAFGALVGGFSGFALLHFAHTNAIAVLAHLPWLLAAEGVLWSATASRRRIALASLAITLLTASQLLLGYPQYVWFSLLAEAAYGVYFASAAPPRQSALVAARWTAAKAVGVMIASVQLLPTYEALRDSTRAGADSAFAVTGSLHPANLVQLVAPYALERRVVGDNTHELGIYFGAVPLALVVWLVASRRLTRASGALLLAAALALGLALGQFGWLYRLQTWLPIVGSFRFPCRAICLMQLALAALAAMAWRELASNRGRLASRVLATLVAIGWAAALAVALLAPPERLAAWPLVFTGPALLTVAAVLVAAAARGAEWAFPALVVMAALDLGLYGLSYGVYPGVEPQAWLASISKPPETPGSRVVLNTALGDGPPNRFVGNEVILAGWRRADGYSGLVPANRLDERDSIARRVAGVGWVATPHGWKREAGFAERVRLEPAGQVRVVRERPGRIDVETCSDEASRLVLGERFHAGWRATIDGSADCLPYASGALLACDVPPGRHTLAIRFAPWSLAWGTWLSGLGVVLSLSWIGWELSRAPKRREPSPNRLP